MIRTPLSHLPGRALSAAARAQLARVAVIALLCGAPTVSSAQSTFASVRGTATDATGAALPGATITLHSMDENTDRTATTDSTGAFQFSNIKPGHFTLVATEAGFATTTLTGIALDARQDLRVPLSLQVAAQSSTVEVTASSDQINTENGTISDSKDNALITELPLNNRATTTSPLGALSLSPNVQQDSQGNIALGGASAAMVNFSVDGISTANVRQNGPLTDAYPSQEGIAAVKVTEFNNSPEFSQVGDVTFITKSGANRFHGSLFEYFQNSALDASPYGFNGKAPKNFNTFGGSISGPVSIPRFYSGKDKTFFFADYEGNRRTLSVNEQYAVPTLAERNGDTTAIQNCPPSVAGAPPQCVPGPVIPQAGINATAKALLAFYPLPQAQFANAAPGSINFETFIPTPASTDGADVRLDQTINSRQSIYARFSRKNILEDVANPLLPNDADSVHNRSLLVSYTYTITPRLLNEFRFGLTNAITSVGFPIEGAAALQQLGLQGVDLSQHPLTHAFPTFNFFNGTQFTPIGRDKTGVSQSKTYQFTDNLTFTLGRHTLKGGVDIRHVRYFDIETFLPSDDFGAFTFLPSTAAQPTTTLPSGQTVPGNNAFANFLLGQPATAYFAVSSPDVGGTTVQSSFFAQDEWQISSRLTLSYGVRYQLLPPFIEDGGNLANFDQSTGSIVVPDNLTAYLKQQNIAASNVAFQQSINACGLPVDPNGQNQAAVPCTPYVTASQDHLPQGLRQTYKGNIQPRVSFAYRPFNDTKTVVRGGFGVFTMVNLGPLSFNNSGNPTSNVHTYTNVQFPSTRPTGAAGVQYGGGNLDQGVDPHFRDPQSNQYSLTVERELNSSNTLRVSLVGMHTYRLNITEDLNQIPASTIPYNFGPTAGVYVDNRAKYQNWTQLFSTFNHGEANYDALQVEASHRMAHGFYYNANYTLAKNLADNQGDNPSGFAGEVNYGFPIANRFNTKADYGNVEGTRRNRFLFTGIGQLPFGQGRRFLNGGGIKDRLFGGWDINTITLIESGPWLTPSTATDASNTNTLNRGALARPDQVATSFAAGRSRAHYFNAAAFQPTPADAGRFGNAGVGILEGPGTKAVSLGVAKQFRITEGSHLRFESTFTNVFNHTNFAPPSTDVDNGNFGQLTAATTAENAGNRTGQFALRFDF